MFRSREKRNVRHRAPQSYDSSNFSYNPDGYEASALESFEKPKKPHRWRRRIIATILILLIIAAAVAAALYFYVDQTTLKGERAGRVNIMVLGVDDAATLSDTIMVVSISTKPDEPYKVAMVSLPRDMYVEIPGFGSSKINAAYTYGQNNDYPGGGPALSRKVVEQTLDLPIHYYVAMDFTGFKQMIDTVGGVDVDVKTPIEDPYYPDYSSGYAPFSISAGPHRLNGEQALAYARSRQTTSDFDRAARQQQIAVAFKDKVLSSRLFTNPTEIARLQTTLSTHFKTDLSLRELAKLGQIAREIQPQAVTRHVIDSSNFLVASQRYGYGLIPKEGVDNFTAIQEFVRNIFSQTTNNIPPQQQ